MTLKEILLGGGGLLVILMTLVQITPIKINPWSAVAKAFGRAINADVLKEVETLKTTQTEMKKDLSKYIAISDERAADSWRASILRFNLECVRGIRHTREDFIDVLSEIDKYERYCDTHKDYPNSRAVHAIANIGRVYDERLQKNDFDKES